jgi:DNA-packaging protein gp3
MARPTDYTPEMLTRAQEYLDSCVDEELERGGKDDERVVYGIKVKLPTKGGLARFLGVSRDTLYEWAKIYDEFSDIMEQLGADQEDKLINNGLSGDYNPTIAKVLLTKHGYREGIEQTGKDGKELIPSGEIEKKAEEAVRRFLNK